MRAHVVRLLGVEHLLRLRRDLRARAPHRAVRGVARGAPATLPRAPTRGVCRVVRRAHVVAEPLRVVHGWVGFSSARGDGNEQR